MEQRLNAQQRQAIAEAMMADKTLGQGSPHAQPALISADMLDDFFTFHKWNPEQVERGNAIRAAAKAFSAAKLAEQEAAKAFVDAMRSSETQGTAAILTPLGAKLRDVAYARRMNAITLASQLIDPKITDSVIEFVCKVVMEINSAITFEAAVLEQIPPEDAHSERATSPVTQTGVAGDAAV